VAFYFFLWYALNIVYNIANKNALNALPLPWTVGAAQLGAGSLWVGLQWALRLRAAPRLEPGALSRALPVAFFHGGGQLATVLSLGAGAVSFTHIVKAAEPLFSAAVAAAAFGQVFRPQVYAALAPVVGGVAVACATELDFSWLSFAAAMASNAFFALRANYSKVRGLRNHSLYFSSDGKSSLLPPPWRQAPSLCVARHYSTVNE
jgi:solute carrier family 35, member E1